MLVVAQKMNEEYKNNLINYVKYHPRWWILWFELNNNPDELIAAYQHFRSLEGASPPNQDNDSSAVELTDLSSASLSAGE